MADSGGVEKDSGGKRRWEIEPAGGVVEDMLLVVLLGPLWLMIEVLLAHATIAATLTPFGMNSEFTGFSDGWPAISLITILLLPLSACTVLGFVGVRSLVRGHREMVVSAGPSGVRVERRTRRGRLVLVANLLWEQIREVEIVRADVLLRGRRDVEIPTRCEEQRLDIAGVLRERVEPAGERPWSPLLDGWTAYVDDLGPTIISEGLGRRRNARWTGGFGVLAWVNTAALATSLDAGIGWWLLTGLAAALAAGFTYATYRLARFTPRWTARPGAVIHIDKPGTAPTFEARSLEHAEVTNDDGSTWHQLYAYSCADGKDPLGRSILSDLDSRPVREAGRWLATAAQIPFRHVIYPPTNE